MQSNCNIIRRGHKRDDQTFRLKRMSNQRVAYTFSLIISLSSNTSSNEILNYTSLNYSGVKLLTSRTVAASVLGRTSSSILTGTCLRAILPEGVLGTQLAAILAAIPGGADASAIDGRTLRVILAVAVILATFAIHVEGTRPGAGLAIPSYLARALSGPWMAQLRIVVLAFANFCAIRPVETIVASTLIARFTCPARTAYTGTVTRIADGIVFASAIICAI